MACRVAFHTAYSFKGEPCIGPSCGDKRGALNHILYCRPMKSNDYSQPRFDWQDLPRPFSVLAPMIDVTDTCFRRLIKAWSKPDVLFSEFVSADNWCVQGEDSVSLRLKFDLEEHPLIAQVWGKSPENYYTTVKRLIERGFSGIDINMGCSITNVIRKGSCARLIEDRSLAGELILATQEAAQGKVPVSIKTRLGFHRIETEDWAGFLLGFEPDALIMHGRVARQLLRESANWDEIGKVVALRDTLSPSTVVVGNGDVRSYCEIQEKHVRYGVDGVMVGRGVLQNPFMFSPDGLSIESMSGPERLALLLKHINLFEKVWGHAKRYATLKKYVEIYVSDYEGASDQCARLVRARSITHARTLINTLLEETSGTAPK
jgi:tRNA-dihydrouridine synthase